MGFLAPDSKQAIPEGAEKLFKRVEQGSPIFMKEGR
jgi:hypothetical protein